MDEYDFGMIRLDCRKFKAQVIETIGKLKRDMEIHLVAGFKVGLDIQVEKNKEVWNKVIA